MFDIDKMYLMFPSFKPQYNINKKLRNYVYKNLRGKTKLETIDNINAVIDQINSDYDTDFNVDEFSESLLNLDINDITDEENLLLNDNISLFVDIILKTKKESPLLNYIKEESEITKVSKLRYENYDNSKPESEQTKAALQNRLIELYKSVLLNENVIGEVMTPVDFTHIKDDILHFVNKKPTTNLSTFNQLDDIDTKYDFSAGKAGVGQQANALMDYVLGSLGNLSITNFNVPKSNNRFDLEYSNTLSDEDIKYYLPIAKKTYENTDAWKKDKIPFNEKEATKQLKSIKIGHSLSAILNAFVDIAKDPYITRGNWVTMTTNTGNLLLRKGVHPFYVNAFLNQPILKEYVEFSASYESSKNQGLSTQDAFIKERFNTNKLSGKDNYELILDKFKYEKNIFNSSLETLRSEANKNNIDYQARVFYTFLQYQSASKAIKDNINASKFMVDGIGGSVNSLIIAKNAVDSILEAEDRYNKLEDKSEFKENIILGFRSKFKNPNGSESIFSKYFNNVILEPLKIVRANPTLFLESNQTIQNTFNEISYDLKNQILVDFEKGNKNLGKILNKTFYSYIMSGFQSLNIQNQERKDLVLKFPKEFEQFQKDNKGKYIIIDQMTVNLGNTLEFVSLNNRKKSQDFEKLMIGSFLDLLNTNEEFANKLIKYSYLTSGFNNHSSQFFTMIPTQWFNRNNINRYIIDTNDSYNSYIDKNDDFFINQFYLANLENRKYVKNVSGKQILENSLNIHGFVLDTPGKAGYYRVKVDDLGQNPDIYYKLIGYDEEYRGVYSRFIPNINDQLSEIKLLNVKDKKGNRIINYDTNGINLKPVTETSPGVAKNINKKTLSDLHDSAIYPRDKFYKGGIVEKDEVVKTEQKIINKTDVLKKQNIFTVKPIQTVDKKATVKASVATQYIGFGEGIVNSSTENYRQQAGEYANTGNYSAEDIIFVSIGGKRGNETVRKFQQDKTIKEALKAIEAGATLITDNKSYVEGSDYNEGEKRLAKNLETKGYNYSEQTVDGQILGVWTNEVKVDNIVEVDDVVENKTENKSEISQMIYNELGNKTQSKNVILPKDVDPEADNIGMKYTTAIDFWRKIVPEAITLYSKAKPLIVAFRGNSKKTFLENYNSGSYTIGNPFNFMNESGNRKEQGIKATKKFIEWMITGNNQNNNDATEKYRQAIIKDIKSGKLKGSSILYYEEKNYATHATALDYLINEYNWETNNIISNKPQQLSLFGATEEELKVIEWQRINCKGQ